MKKRMVSGIFAALGILVLIFDAATALVAAQEALQICIRVVIPSLFPFFVLINLLSSSLSGMRLRWLSPLEKLLQIPAGSGGFYLCGLLGGYPTGAQMIHTAWRSGTLDRRTAQQMLAFCSNAGPAFLFGMIGPMFSDLSTVWIIWLIHIASSVLVGFICRNKSENLPLSLQKVPISLPHALRRAVEVIAYVCGWVILFRVLIGFLSRWFLWCLPIELEVAITSLLELANGCTSLRYIDNEGLRMIVASATVNFGGICVLVQTASVTPGLKISSYTKGKVLQTAFAVIMTAAVQRFLFTGANQINLNTTELICALLIFLFLLFLARFRKIAVDFRRKMLYNAVRNKLRG